ncbi:MAG: hypothetical protein VCG02_20495 [Verrucomicrobiota bacterium]|jgi:hypothetical protein
MRIYAAPFTRLGLLIGMVLLCGSCAEQASEGAASGPRATVGDKNVRHGIWIETHEDGSRKSHGRFTRGLPTGLHRTWHVNGQPATERRYDWDGKLHKKQVDFNEDGERIAKFFYEHGEAEEEGDEAESDEDPPGQAGEQSPGERGIDEP